MEMTATHVKNNFGAILKVLTYEDVIVKKNGKAIAKISAYSEPNSSEILMKDGSAAYGTSEDVSYEAFLELSENSKERYELINGRVYLLASPRITHQEIVGNIYADMHTHFKGKDCGPFLSPFDITLEINGKKNVVQPDVGIICDMDEHRTEKDKYMGVPTLVVEVLSPSTRSKDMITKLNLYSLSGVREYWLVDPKKMKVFTYFFEHEELIDSDSFRAGETIRSMYFEGLEVAWD